jgi:NAD(P)-dependent dehydrogenase (short-subunit alcohol dehydrogenase family)
MTVVSSNEQRVAVIAGAAGALGLGIARRFGEAGNIVVLAGADRDRGGAAAAGLRDARGTPTFMALNLRDGEQVNTVAQRIVSEHGRIDVWVNNPGAASRGPAESFSWTDWDESIASIVTGAFYCSQAAGRAMLARGSGVIVNVASVSGYRATEGGVAGSVANAGLIMLTKALGIEWAARGIRVVGVAPGVAMIDDTDAIPPATPAGDFDRGTPMRRPGGISEVAEAVHFMSSDEATYIVGETLVIDGGWTAYHLF